MSIFDAFEGTKEEDKKKRQTCPYKFAWIDRVINNYLKTIPKEPRRQDTIWCSTLGRNMCPRQFVVEYWRPDPIVSNFKKEAYTRCGHVLHNIVQRYLGEAGILRGDWEHPDGEYAENCYSPGPDWRYKELSVFHEGYRFSGKLDGILSVEGLKYLQQKDLKWDNLAIPSAEKEVQMEIKTMGDKKYKDTKSGEDLEFGYRLQATIYQAILGVDETLFILYNRDNMQGKTLIYNGEPELWAQAVQFAKTVWTAIKNKTLPEPLNPIENDPWEGINFLDWVQDHESARDDWPFLGNTVTE
jgi:hypothetical protein